MEDSNPQLEALAAEAPEPEQDIRFFEVGEESYLVTVARREVPPDWIGLGWLGEVDIKIRTVSTGEVWARTLGIYARGGYHRSRWGWPGRMYAFWARLSINPPGWDVHADDLADWLAGLLVNHANANRNGNAPRRRRVNK